MIFTCAVDMLYLIPVTPPPLPLPLCQPHVEYQVDHSFDHFATASHRLGRVTHIRVGCTGSAAASLHQSAALSANNGTHQINANSELSQTRSNGSCCNIIIILSCILHSLCIPSPFRHLIRPCIGRISQQCPRVSTV